MKAQNPSNIPAPTVNSYEVQEWVHVRRELIFVTGQDISLAFFFKLIAMPYPDYVMLCEFNSN